MAGKVEKVLISLDASKELPSTAIITALHGLFLRPLDKTSLLGIIPPLPSPATTPPSIACGFLMRYKRKLDSSWTIKQKEELSDQEMERKMDAYRNKTEVWEITDFCRRKQIEFDVHVQVGYSLKDITVEAASKMGATCVILDRQMKKDGKYIMENLSCSRLLRLKTDNTIEYLRQPRGLGISMSSTERGQSSHRNCDCSHIIHEETSSRGQPQQQAFENMVCSVCNNRRPSIGFFKQFEFKDLKDATNSFSPQNLMSDGGGIGKDVHMGQLANGLLITVKEHSFFSDMVRKHSVRDPKEKEKEFKSEVRFLGEIRDENVAMLVGFCSEDGHRLLVYEHVCDGSLEQYLSNKRELKWDNRMKIATGAAKGLQYLHGRRIYGNVRPWNIFLTHDHHPLLMNFELTRHQYDEPGDQTLGRDARRTFEYVAPEYAETGKDSSKSDVYSFGVILLELITGRRTTQDTNGESLLRWARPLVKKKMYGDLIDPVVMDSHDLHQLFCLVHLVEKCLSWDPDRRFSIDKVVAVLTCISQGLDTREFSPPESL